MFSVFGVAWMADTFFQAHIDVLVSNLGSVVEAAPWTYAVVLVIVSKLVNSQAAALVAIAPIGLQLGIDPAVIVGFYGAAYGYFILPTYPSIWPALASTEPVRHTSANSSSTTGSSSPVLFLSSPPV